MSRVRKLLIGVIAAVPSVVVAAVGVDFGAAIYAEYRLARSVRSASEPELRPVGRHPRLSVHHAGEDRHYDEVEIRANGVDHPVVGKVS